MKSHVFGSAVIALLSVLFLESAMAFELLDPPRRWFPPADEPRSLLIDNTSGGLNGVADSDGGVSAAISAANAWDSPNGGATIDVIAASGSSANITLGDGVSQMLFTDPFGVCERTCLAATFTGYYDTNQTATCDGFAVVKIDDSDIVFNSDPGFGPFRIGWTSEAEDPNGVGCSNETYIETVTSHEVGHLIGLGHEDQVVALMNSSVGSCDNKAILDDDVAGRDELYNCTFNDGGSDCGNGVCDTGETATGCTADCTVCGDSLVTGGEVCDGNSESCGLLGFVNDGTTVNCNNTCDGYDTSSCTDCAGSETSCDDGVDNDCDGLTDGDDILDCPASCTITESPEATCNDNIDNDCDGAIDSGDSDCSTGLPVGASCTLDNECASGKCRGRPGAKTCK
jgi:hypothetical protein